MERVKYYIPDIEVKCTTSFCRQGKIVKMLPGSDDAGSVFIEYADGDKDSARIGYNDYYDLEFVHEKDVLLQKAMERFPKGCSFTSLVGTEITNFDPKYPMWGKHDDTTTIYIVYDTHHKNALVYEDGRWANLITDEDTESRQIRKYDVGDTLVLLHQVKRNKDAYCNVDPSIRNLAYHNGWKTDVGEYEVLDIAYSPDKENWYYKISSNAWYSQDSFEEVKKPVPTEESDVFPVEGQCKELSVDLLEYLRKTRTPEGDQSLKDRAKAICWNHKGYWFVSRSSQKKEYSHDYLSEFFTQKPKPSMEPQKFEYSQEGGFQLTLPPEIVGAALSQATQTHFRESEKKFEKHREDVVALIDKKKQMIETELYQKFEKTISCEFVEFKTKVVEDYLTSKQVVIELGQDKKYEFSLEDKHSELPKMVTFLQLFKQAMIVGPSGSGKSTMAKQAAEVMGLRYGAFSCNLEASKSELVGFANIDGYVESSFLDFYENGGVFLVDEL